MDNQSSSIELNDGNKIPQIGLGVWQATPEQTAMAVREALQVGYRHIDTASIYRNESGVGVGFRESGLPRQEVFITTKIWNDDQGDTLTRDALSKSLERMKLDYIDLLLIHWPVPHHGLFIETWQTMIDLQKTGLIRSIGVSNFTESNLKQIIDETGVTPVLNQIELHPYLQQSAMQQVHSRLGIKTEAWSPLAQNQAISDAAIIQIARKHNKTPAQIVIRWHLENNTIVIPKSVTPSRIKENIDVFNFTLDIEDKAAIAKLDKNQRLGPDPLTFG
ncbi:aldo/keto reductase [uncultured Tolumonas sp.]|uniref:aldo/keto reductase n=1 Tax=uncultured Tolumonas sp. TaxID=263765 RepID=UPI002A0A6B53|nr:aldo/keto reductase [uncultured Tolumonas sp.]